MSEEHTADVDVSAKKLTSWSNEPTLLDLKQDLTEAASSHSSQTTKITEWLDNLHVRGKALANAPKGNSQIVPRLIRKQAEWRYASLSEPFLSAEDLFDVKPVTWEDRESARQNKIVINNQFNTVIDKVAFIDEYVRAAVDEGTAIVRVGWEFEEEEYEKQVPEVYFHVDPSQAPLMEELARMKEENATGWQFDVPEELKMAFEKFEEQGIPFRAEIIGMRTETTMRTVKNNPTLELCHHDDVIFDPTCMGDLSKANFVIHRFPSSLSDLEKDGRYTNLNKINHENADILGEPDNGPDNQSSFNFVDKPRKKFIVHEYWGYWDIDGSGIVQPIVASWVGNTLIRLEENPFPDKKPPFVTANYLPVRRSLYGEPDGALLEDNQKIIGAVTRGMIDILGKSANGQTGMRKDMLDTTNKRKWEQGKDYEFNANVDPRQGVFMHTFPEIPQSAQYMLQAQNMEAESLTGVKAFNNGITGDSLGQTATGTRGALDAASKRELGILRRLAQGVVQLGRKIIAMNQEFLSEEEVIRITNDEFVKVRRDDLRGHFDLRLTISTAEENEAKAQELAFMLQTIGPDEDPQVRRMILADIMRLRKMPDLAKKVESYQPQPDPMQQQIQQLELEKLQAEIDKLKSETQENLAQAGEKSAKADNISADTDKKSLDFVEQESGVTQARELERVGEQARSQATLKAMDHNFEREQTRKEALRAYVEKGAQE